MSDELVDHYKRELSYLHHMGAEFAKANPKIAGRLRIGSDVVEDPHVSRLLDGVAFLNARIRRKLDDDFPELITGLMGLLYPHYLRPIPSMAIVRMAAKSDLSTGYEVARGTEMLTEPVDGEPCRFRTCYDTTVWPIEVEAAALTGQPIVAPTIEGVEGAKSAIRIALRCAAPTMTFAGLAPTSLRFYLKGQAQHVFGLYELLMNDLLEVVVALGPDDREPRRLGRAALHGVGFGEDEAMLPYPARSFVGYRLLTEYFTFPQKFLFVELADIPAAAVARLGERMEIFFYLRAANSDLQHAVGADTFVHGCTPIVNLFPQRAEPIDLSHTTSEYRVIPDARRAQAMEVYSIDEVRGSADDGSEDSYQPFYGVTHATAGSAQRRFWHGTRRAAGTTEGVRDPGTEVYLSVVDLDFSPSSQERTALDLRTTCLNRDLPSRLPFGGGQPRLRLAAGGAPLASIECLTSPTPTRRPDLGYGAFWRLHSHLSLNHLSLDGDDAGAALREILRLYDFNDSDETASLIEGLADVRSRRIAARTPGQWGGICRGTEITIQLAPERFTGSGMFLFASVLERFVALYASINSFTQLVATVKGREGMLRRWAPRAGDKTLL